MAERLQKILSQWGIASRREAEKMISAGRVRVNGTMVDLGQKANPEEDRIEVDGITVKPANRPQQIYLLIHKPLGVVSTCHDPQNRPTVMDLLPAPLKQEQGIHPVGRLDANSTGALLLTNDGELTFYLTHPRHCVPKTYQVWVQGKPTAQVLQAWRQGIILSGRKTLPAQVRVIEQHSEQTLLEIVLTEGRNRQIRRVAEQLGYPVLHLHRTAIGPIKLQQPGTPGLASGQYRQLKKSEISFLQEHIKLTSKRVPAEAKGNHV